MPSSTATAAAPRSAATGLIRSIGARVTAPRVAVLAVLLQARRALTHGEIERRAGGIDRVTVYRVLDWLTQSGIAHRISGTDRVWRFNAAAPHRADGHAHFQCNCCGTVICLDQRADRYRPRLPAGYRQEQVELTIHGRCVNCGPAVAKQRAQRRYDTPHRRALSK
jgi:Fur family ferric uptake transcriptional regulator